MLIVLNTCHLLLCEVYIRGVNVKNAFLFLSLCQRVETRLASKSSEILNPEKKSHVIMAMASLEKVMNFANATHAKGISVIYSFVWDFEVFGTLECSVVLN